MKVKNEVWKPVRGFENYYEVSNLGRVRSLTRLVTQNNQYSQMSRLYKGRILRPCTATGYAVVTLTEKEKRVQGRIHRLVAQAFIPNPDNLPQVNHKNENKLDNRVENLEWCTLEYNVVYGTRILRAAESKSIPVVAEKNGSRFEFPNAYVAAQKTGTARENIIACCNGKRHTAMGYSWSYLQKE